MSLRMRVVLSRSDRDPRSSRDLCAQVTPRRRTKELLS